MAFLLAATLAVVLVRALLVDDPGATPPQRTPAADVRGPVPGPRVYTVLAGDTLATIAAETGVPVVRLEKLNPQVEPTSLFIGDRIRLR